MSLVGVNIIKQKHEEYRVKFFQELSNLLQDHSFSDDLIQKIELNLNMAKGYHHILFPEGKDQILKELERWQDDLMQEFLSNFDKPEKIRERIAVALEARILNIIPKDASAKISAIFLVPSYILSGKKSAWKTCDAIWRYAGDESVDFNYYTKRSLLLGVYLSVKAFYYADNSEHHQDTKEFIRKSLDQIINSFKIKNQLHLPKINNIPILRFFLS